MRTKLSSLLTVLFIALPLFALSQEQINLPGFGQLPVKKDGSHFTVDFPKYGQFTFTGSIDPLALETEATIDQLKKIPGYSILANLGLKDIKLKLSNAGFEIEALADTRKNLAGLFNMLNVSEPLMKIGAKVTSKGFALSGVLDFTRKPIVLNLVPDHTRFTYEKVSIEAQVGNTGANPEPGITAKVEMRMKPTKWDPDLKTIMEVSYDLISQEITASGSMVDTWKNPIGISNLLKKDVMTFTNTAISLGWIPGAPSPTTIGFALEQGKIFHLDFGIMMSLSPADGEIALWGFRDRMTMNDFTSILRDGFGLKVPNVFPEDIYIENANILFSPNGGEVGEFEIESGFAMNGKAKFLGAVEGSLNFHANMDDGFFVDLNLDAAFKEALMKEIRKAKPLAPIMDQVLSTLEVRKVRLNLEAGADLTLKGQTNVHISVINKPIKFDFQGSFDPQTLAKEIAKRVVDVAGGEAAAAVKKVASNAANASIRTAKAGYNKLGYYAKHASTWKDHATHGSRVPFTGKLIHPSCYDKCVPDRAKKLSNPVYESSNKAVKDFYDKVYPKVAEVADKSLRVKYIKDDWNRLTNSIDNNWEKIIRDDHYMGYDKDQKDVQKLGRRYRELVRAKKQEHVNYRNKLWNKLMTEHRVPDYILNMPSTIVPTGRKFYIQSAMNYGKNKGGYWDVPGRPETIKKGSNIQVWDLDSGHDRTYSFYNSKEKGYYEIKIGNTVNSRIDIQGGKKDNGTSVKTWERHRGANQRFRFYHLGDGRFKIFDRKSGKPICLSGRKNENGTNVHIWEDHDGDWMEWYLIDAETKKPFVPVEIPVGSAFHIQSAMNYGKDNNGFWDVPGYPEIIKKGSNIQIFTLDEGHDRIFKPIQSVDMDYYEIQIGNTSSARVDIDHGRAKNGTNVKVWERNGAKAQRFTFFHLGDGRFKIYDRNGMVICLAGRKNENRTNVHIWEDHNGAWMEWLLIDTKTKKPFVPD